MSVIIITGGGGGHNAVKFLAHQYHDMTPDEQADAVHLLREFVANVNDRFNQKFDTTNL